MGPVRRRRVVDVLGALRAVVAIAILAWLPGYAWTRALLPRLAPIERFVLSVALSIAAITLALLVGNLILRIPLGGPLGIGAALLLAAMGALVEFSRRFKQRAGARAEDPSPTPADLRASTTDTERSR